MSAINAPPLTKGLAQSSRDRNSPESLWRADTIRRRRISLRVLTVFLVDHKSVVRIDDGVEDFHIPLILKRKHLNDGSSPHVGWENLNFAPGTSERWFWVLKKQQTVPWISFHFHRICRLACWELPGE